MTWSPEAQARTARRIQALVESPSPLREVALALDALPLYVDLESAICLRPEGTFVATFWDTGTPCPVDPRSQIMALITGARAHPELADLFESLLPARPADAKPCRPCVGAGRVGMAAFCGACLGLGWRGEVNTEPDDEEGEDDEEDEDESRQLLN